MSRSAPPAWPDEVVPATIEVHRLRVPLVAPRVAAHGTESVRESILVAASDADGCTGWGECVALARPTYTGEWIEGAWSVTTQLLVPAALAGSPHGVVGHPMAEAAVADALLDLVLRREETSLSSVLGSAPRVPSRAVVGLAATVEDLVAVVDERLRCGHRAVKLKIEPQTARRTLAAVRERWPDLDLAADANGSFVPGEHDDVLRAIDELGLSYLEQPFSPDDLEASAGLRRAASTPVALDEAVTSIGAIRRAAALEAVDLVNLKPARWGGVRRAVAATDALEAAGIGAFVGGMYELGVARSSALAVAGRGPLAAHATDLGPSASYVAADLTPPHVLDADGCLPVPTGPGFGPAPEPAALEPWTLARVALRP